MRVKLITQTGTRLIYHQDSECAEPQESFLHVSLKRPEASGSILKCPEASLSPLWVWGFGFKHQLSVLMHLDVFFMSCRDPSDDDDGRS